MMFLFSLGYFSGWWPGTSGGNFRRILGNKQVLDSVLLLCSVLAQPVPANQRLGFLPHFSACYCWLINRIHSPVGVPFFGGYHYSGSVIWPALLLFGIPILPYVVWDPFAIYDDVWRWSNGQGETGYQIWGWGASNYVLAFGWVDNRFATWPFWWLEGILAVPTFAWFLYRQWRTNTLANACWHYGVFLFIFFYGSRFLNENYLAYILAFLALGILISCNVVPGRKEESTGRVGRGSKWSQGT